MNNFELIDDYLTNRLSEGEKEGFEKQLGSDPALKADVDLQRSILEGIKGARAAQLKSMLNNVPIPSGHVVEFTMARMAASIIGAGVIGAAVYFYFQPGDVPNLKDASADFAKKGAQMESAQDQTATEVKPLEEVKQEFPASAAPKEKVKEENAAPSKASSKEEIKEVSQRKLDIIDPSDDLKDENKPGSSESSKKSISASHVDVETDTANKKYTFHYQFASGKLFLYGPFDKNLYEILEINSDAHSVFLFYKDNYFLLDEKQIKISKLEPINDDNLLRKLKAYRGK